MTEEELDALIDIGTTVAPLPEPDWGLLPIDDITSAIARKIFPPEDIAKRYQLTASQLIDFISRPAVLKVIRQKRMLWESEGNLDDKLKALSQVGIIETLPSIFAMMSDSNLPPSVRLDAFKTAGKFAERNSAKDGVVGGVMAARFAVTINFPGAARTETITVDGQEAA